MTPGSAVSKLLLAIGMSAAITLPYGGVARGAPQTIDYGSGPNQALVKDSAGRKTPQYKLMYPTSPATWQGPMHWSYNASNAPQQWSANNAAAVQLITSAAAKWSAACGVEFVYDGETNTAPYSTLPSGEVDRINVIGWKSLDGGMYGATYWTHDSIPGGRFAIIDSDTMLNPAFVGSTEQLMRTMAHEWGHALGLNHSNVSDALMSGPPDTSYANVPDLTTDDVHGCRCLYGPPAGQRAGYVCSLPERIDYGTLDANTVSAPYMINVSNSGSAPLAVSSVRVGSAYFSIDSNTCAPGTPLAPASSCAFTVSARTGTSGVSNDEAVIDTSEGPYRIPLRVTVRDGTAPAPVTPPATPPVTLPQTVDVIEYYHPNLDHYFISASPDDINALDGGRYPGWARTGRSFRAYASAAGGMSPVCRIYIPPPYGESHFFSASSGECAQTITRFPQFVLESSAVMYLGLPDQGTGACPAGLVPVYRLWNNRGDSNHRYTTDRGLRDAMVAKGYRPEGYGPDAVAMCAVQ